MKKAIAILLSVILIFACCSGAVFANDASSKIDSVLDNSPFENLIVITEPDDVDFDLALKTVTAIVTFFYEYFSVNEEHSEIEYDNLIAKVTIIMLFLYNLSYVW